MSVKVRYLGKKSIVHLKLPWLSKEYVFKENMGPVVMTNADARRLIDDNPKSYRALVSQEEKARLLSDAGLDGDEEVEEDFEEEVPKYPYLMNKAQLVSYAENKFGEQLDINQTKAELLEAVNTMGKEEEAVE